MASWRSDGNKMKTYQKVEGTGYRGPWDRLPPEPQDWPIQFRTYLPANNKFKDIYCIIAYAFDFDKSEWMVDAIFKDKQIIEKIYLKEMIEKDWRVPSKKEYIEALKLINELLRKQYPWIHWDNEGLKNETK